MGRVFTVITFAPLLLVMAYAVFALGVSGVAGCGDWNAARIPQCALGNWEVGNIVYSTLGLPFYAFYALLWMGISSFGFGIARRLIAYARSFEE